MSRKRRKWIVRTGITAICALATLVASLVLAAPVLANPLDRGHDRQTFSVGQPLGVGCAGFFTSGVPTIDGWEGQLHQSWTLDGPFYSDISIAVHGTWTDPVSGLGYRIRFKGEAAGPMTFVLAAGDVDIRRSDGSTLTGAAEFIGDAGLVNLNSVTCS
jgi:hypothetical protein